ncbi:4336_t:CDS:1, partial [Racocetra fulgida]
IFDSQLRKNEALLKSPSKEPLASNISQQTNPPQTISRILFPNYGTDHTPTAIIPHSQHYHTCVI